MAKISARVTKLLTLTLLLLHNVCCRSHIGERSLSTSVVGMEFLLEKESELLTAMENYANQMENKLGTIQSAIKEFRTEYLKSEINPEEYLSNPINSYALIRRLHEDWEKWKQFLGSLVAPDEIYRIKNLQTDIPNRVDLMEATEAIHRLNVVYDIDPGDMAKGLINGKQYDARFSAIDCFSIGYQMFKKKIYYLSGVWLYTSLQLYRDSDINAVLEFDKIKILELYAEVLLKQDDLIEALKFIKIALNLSPHKAELLRTKSEIEFKIRTQTKTEAEITEQDQKDSFSVRHAYKVKNDCRQYTYRSKLHCLYNRTTTAFLQLAPLKMEILHLDPYVVLYHDVISDVEIANLKNVSRNKLSRAKTFNTAIKHAYVNKERTVKSYWFINSANIIGKIHQRITDMSGFGIVDADFTEILNYGMGGHYGSHYDFFNLSEVSEPGDRIATVLFYLSDVDQGGDTVFPKIQLSVHPKKGTALMWYNLDIKGEVDTRAWHGACPVIVGSKWVLTKWIEQYSQMFRRRCFA